MHRCVCGLLPLARSRTHSYAWVCQRHVGCTSTKVASAWLGKSNPPCREFDHREKLPNFPRDRLDISPGPASVPAKVASVHTALPYATHPILPHPPLLLRRGSFRRNGGDDFFFSGVTTRAGVLKATCISASGGCRSRTRFCVPNGRARDLIFREFLVCLHEGVPAPACNIGHSATRCTSKAM